MPFDIPQSWEWVRLGSIFALEMGQSPAGNTVSEVGSGMEFHQGKVFFSEKVIKHSNQVTTAPTKIAEPNSVLLCVRAPVGKVNITDRELCIGRGLCAIKPLAGMAVDFVFHLLETYESIFVKKATGTTFVAITGEVVKQQLIPLPPLAEQKRIVAAIQAVIPFVDSYGKSENTLSALNTAFPNRLKKSILQMAVQGKLVPQDPTDEPAEALLERIREEKQRLVREGKIKKDKQESVIFRRDNSHYEKLGETEWCIDEETPFEIPENWCWSRLGDVITLISGTDFKPEDYNDIGMGTPYITGASNLSENGVIISRWTNTPKNIAYQGDILLVCKGSGYGKTVVCDVETAHIARQIMAIRKTRFLNMGYIRFYMQMNIHYLKSKGQGVIPGIDRESILRMLFPLPPLSEQHRIVAKIEELLPMVKGL